MTAGLIRLPRTFGSRVLLSSGVVAAMAFLLRLLGYAEKRVLAFFFGTGDAIECFFVALQLALILYFFFRGLLRVSVVPALVQARTRSLEHARRFGFTCFVLVVGVCVPVSVTGILFAEELVALQAPGFSTEKSDLCVRLTRLLFVSPLFLLPSYLLVLSLEARKRFGTASFCDSLQKLLFLPLVFVVAWIGSFELISPAFLVSAAATFAFYLLTHRNLLISFRFPVPETSAAKAIIALSAPLIVGNAISQLGKAVQTRYASTLESGSVAAVKFAQALIDLPLLMAPVSLSFVLYPFFCEFAEQGDLQKLGVYAKRSCRFLVVLFAPAALLTVVLREEVVTFLFGGGEFGSDSVHLTSLALLGMAPGLPVFAVETILVTYLFSRKKMVLAVAIGATATVSSALLVPSLAELLGVTGVAAYGTIAKTLKIVIIIAAARHLGLGFNIIRALRFTLLLLVALVPCGIVATVLSAYADRLQILLFLPLAAGTSLAAYALSLHLLRMEEWKFVLAAARRRRRATVRPRE